MYYFPITLIVTCEQARRLAIAEYQHILYNEWLPIILGKQYMATLNLFPLSAGFSRDYDPSVDPRINNEFAAAGMRFGHSLIPGLINVYNRVGQEVNPAFRLVLLTPQARKSRPYNSEDA
jgi:hypothetical protein